MAVMVDNLPGGTYLYDWATVLDGWCKGLGILLEKYGVREAIPLLLCSSLIPSLIPSIISSLKFQPL